MGERCRGTPGGAARGLLAVPFIVMRGISPFLERDLTTFKGNILAAIPAKDNLFRGPRLLVWSELFSEEMLMQCAPRSPTHSLELMGSLKFGNVWVFVQLIHRPTWTED